MALRGAWRSRGYGWILKLDSARYALHDVTTAVCVEFETGTLGEFEAGFQILASETDDHVRLRVRNDITHYDFDRIPALPANTLAMSEPRNDSPLDNFEFFCESFAQDYAFFELRGVDWKSSCNRARTTVSEQTTDDELFDTLHSLIAPLEDNHVILTDGVRQVNSEKIAGIKSLLRSALGLTSATIGNPHSIEILNPYLDNMFLEGNAKTAANGSVLWGKVAPGIGYLNFLRFFGLAESEQARLATDLPTRRPDHATFQSHDLAAIEEIMERVLGDLGDCDSIILDVRLNGGGFDKIGMAVAGYFADRTYLAFTKQAKLGTGLTSKQHFDIGPSKNTAFTRPVFVLTSARTSSAGDVFALCMRALPNTTLVGQPSTGILSDNLAKHLPNGWKTSISNEIYGSPSGEIYEGPGVPVDIETPVFVEGDFDSGYRIAFDTALQLASRHSA